MSPVVECNAVPTPESIVKSVMGVDGDKPATQVNACANALNKNDVIATARA
jgi:hypothetical protein